MQKRLLAESLGASALILLTAFPIFAQPRKDDNQLSLNSLSQPQEQIIVGLVDRNRIRQVRSNELTSMTDDIPIEIVQTPTGQTPNEIGQERYRELVRTAKEKIANLPANVLLRFTIGVNYPVRLGAANPNTSQSQWEVIGWVNQNQEAKPLTSSDVLEMFERQLETLNRLSPTRQPETQTSPNSTPNQTDNTPQPPPGISVLNLIARNRQNGQFYLLPNVRYISVFRDALNATLNDELKLNTFDINGINPRIIPPGELEEI
ncbi:MAG: hypothetical protein QNJ65_10930 [Xenococcaceae cyanobacterium MO_234.B1]|nr:hypothetical protein [Xenococcaceae cyanobacterium MO_234.B1]